MVEQLPLKRQIARVRVLAIRIIVTKVLGLSVENPRRLVFTTEQYCLILYRLYKNIVPRSAHNRKTGFQYWSKAYA